MDTKQQSDLWLMLGEIRGDLKYLVNARKFTDSRLEALETLHKARDKEIEDRLGKLEHFKTRIGVLTASLGIAVPSAITVGLKAWGLL